MPEARASVATGCTHEPVRASRRPGICSGLKNLNFTLFDPWRLSYLGDVFVNDAILEGAN
jgi:hypothetical protein